LIYIFCLSCAAGGRPEQDSPSSGPFVNQKSVDALVGQGSSAPFVNERAAGKRPEQVRRSTRPSGKWNSALAGQSSSTPSLKRHAASERTHEQLCPLSGPSRKLNSVSASVRQSTSAQFLKVGGRPEQVRCSMRSSRNRNSALVGQSSTTPSLKKRAGRKAFEKCQ
ncbi:uncharacterized protein LOC118180728, partial [Stegodyphus dumicola]|uniref:uncharacterized protein LOC118180728 n=1 Tax=Stegodyphus dumicola TaxID=202533 RepID=UPI0015ADEC02